MAHFEALNQDYQGALFHLVELNQGHRTKEFGTRGTFDGPQLALRIAIETRDTNGLDHWASVLSVQGESKSRIRVGAALRAQARLWWDELLPEDLELESFAYAPAAEAIEVIARWRKGQVREDDVEAMSQFEERNPDAKYEGRLAQAAALLGLGRLSEALDGFFVLDRELEVPARDDFALKQIRDLTRAVWVVALEADGQTSRALDEGRKLRPELTDNLLPAILVDEVLARSER